jgi:hypothetical protein
MQRETLINYIKRHDAFFEFANFNGHSDEQLIALIETIKNDEELELVSIKN